MSIQRWMNKENVVHIHNEILLGYLREGNDSICRQHGCTWRLTHWVK